MSVEDTVVNFVRNTRQSWKERGERWESEQQEKEHRKDLVNQLEEMLWLELEEILDRKDHEDVNFEELQRLALLKDLVEGFKNKPQEIVIKDMPTVNTR